MNRVNKSLLAAAVIAGLAGGVNFVRAGAAASSRAPQRLDEEHWKHVHLHNAKVALKEARTHLVDAEDVFKGHKEEAIAHVDHALKEVQIAADEAGGEATDPANRPAASQLEEGRFPHMHKAFDRLKDALSELQSADKFNGHRDAAIDETQKAIDQLERGIHDAER